MPVFLQCNENSSEFLIWEITESCDELLNQLENINLVEYNAIKSIKRKKEYLVARLALKKILRREVNILHTQAGKPYIEAETNISITHSGFWLAVIVNKNYQVGIDIELITDKISKLYKRFMSAEEQLDFNQGENLHQLHVIWSGKEALYKIIGYAAVDFSNHLRVLPFLQKEYGQITAIHTTTNQSYTLYYQILNGFSLVYCIK